MKIYRSKTVLKRRQNWRRGRGNVVDGVQREWPGEVLSQESQSKLKDEALSSAITMREMLEEEVRRGDVTGASDYNGSDLAMVLMEEEAQAVVVASDPDIEEILTLKFRWSRPDEQ